MQGDETMTRLHEVSTSLKKRREEEKEKEKTHTLIQIPRPPAGSFIDGGISGVQLDHLICLRKSVQDGPNSNFVKIFFNENYFL